MSNPDGQGGPGRGRRGAPRLQYVRVYVLLPPTATAKWIKAVVSATWDARRWTVGGSADDAGIGDLDRRVVILVNPKQWKGDIYEFFATCYPGVELVTVEATTLAELEQRLKEVTL